MDFITEDFIKENKLTEGQVEVINKVGDGYIADVKKEADTKASEAANENAEKILHGATKKLEELTGIKHENGTKISDYLLLSTDGYFSGTKASLERKEKELEEKLKAEPGDQAIKLELIESKNEVDRLKKVEADHSELVKGDYKNLYETANNDLIETKKQVAFGNVKPKFADNINEYEAKAKWNDFVSGTLKKYKIHLGEDRKAIAIDRENEYKTVELSQLVKENAIIQELVKGRQQTGPGVKLKLPVKIDGLDFDVPENANAQERQKAIKDYITGVLKIQQFDVKYSEKFAEYNKKILEKIPA
jgi:hypothetical protein